MKSYNSNNKTHDTLNSTTVNYFNSSLKINTSLPPITLKRNQVQTVNIVFVLFRIILRHQRVNVSIEVQL